jgi:hypothetical protein
LLDIPQLEELPSEARLIKPEHQDKYLGQLEPFLRFHGFKKITWGDWLEFNALHVEDELQAMRKKESGYNDPDASDGK